MARTALEAERSCSVSPLPRALAQPNVPGASKAVAFNRLCDHIKPGATEFVVKSPSDRRQQCKEYNPFPEEWYVQAVHRGEN